MEGDCYVVLPRQIEVINYLCNVLEDVKEANVSVHYFPASMTYLKINYIGM